VLKPDVATLWVALRVPVKTDTPETDLLVLVSQLTYVLITPPPVGGRGIVFGRFLCFFVSNISAGPICMKFSGNVWSDHSTT